MDAYKQNHICPIPPTHTCTHIATWTQIWPILSSQKGRISSGHSIFFSTIHSPFRSQWIRILNHPILSSQRRGMVALRAWGNHLIFFSQRNNFFWKTLGGQYCLPLVLMKIQKLKKNYYASQHYLHPMPIKQNKTK